MYVPHTSLHCLTLEQNHKVHDEVLIAGDLSQEDLNQATLVDSNVAEVCLTPPSSVVVMHCLLRPTESLPHP